jgi:phenylacetate-coenzyme A ligase PaaK-like adenylate-forming protein
MDLSSIKGLALGGDQVTPGYRARVKELLESMGAKRPRVQSVFGFTEARKCWSECPGESDSGFHTYPDLELVEIIDPETGKPAGEGETGELVYTALAGRGSCVIRYRTGDLIVGGLNYQPCPHCGRTVPRLASQLERVSNLKNFQLSKVKGTLVNLNIFKEELESEQRIEEWQLIIKKRNDDPFDVDELYLNVALSDRVSERDRERVLGDLERKLFQVTEVKFNEVRLMPLKQLLDLLGMETLLKEKRIVDLRVAAAPKAVEPKPGEPRPGECRPGEVVKRS